MWSKVEREVSKHPHNTLTSLKAKISEIMTEIDREAVILLCQRFWFRLRLLWRPEGISFSKCVCIMQINFF
jgi:hypothetical protein